MAWLFKLVGGFVWDLICKAIPALAPPDPKQQAQAEKDRADTAEGLLKAKVEGDAIEDNFDRTVAADPDKLRQHDKFEIKH
jgi:hypothetical protein